MTNNNRKSLIGQIPELYYDIIARVTPGAIIVFSFIILKYSFIIKIKIINLKDIATGFVLLVLIIFFIISYSVGMLIHAISQHLLRIFFIEKYAWKKIKESDAFIDLIVNIPNIYANKDEIKKKPQKFDRYIHDYIKTKNHTLGPILAKARAEAYFCSSLLAGFFILLLAEILHPWQGGVELLKKILTLRVVTLMILFSLCFWASWLRLKGYVNRTFIYMRLI